MKEHYELKEIEVEELFKHLHIQSMDYEVRQFEVVGVGNLLIMECLDSEALQMDSFVLTPYFKRLPLYSTDYMYIKERRSFLNEIYNLVDKSDEVYEKYIDKFREHDKKYEALPNMKVKECWYDDIRPVCIAKDTKPENDDEILEIFFGMLRTFIEMEKESAVLSEEEYGKKWEAVQNYTDGLVDNGGVSTDLFKAVIGPEKTKEFFNSVFFGPSLYKK